MNADKRPAVPNQPTVPNQDEVDVLEQQTPAAPEPQDDDAGSEPDTSRRDPALPEGSEADRLEQETDAGGPPEDEDEYPRNEPE